VNAEVIIPTWNRAADLRAALDSLRAQTLEPDVCVIDNGSTDRTAEMVTSEYPEVRLIRLEENVGFGRAVNEAVSSSTAEAIILMNNDAQADRSFVAELVETHAATGAAMVAGCMQSREGTIESAGVVADQSLVAYDHLFGVPAAALDGSPAPLGPSGGAALYGRQHFVEGGMYDEEIFAYLEDLDLALRLRLRGETCALAAGARVTHRHSATLGSGSSAKNRLLARNRRYLVWKYSAGMSRRVRARGLLIDLAVTAGRTVIDRNVGAIAGWREAASRFPRRKRPSGDVRLDGLPLLRLSILEALRGRLARRR